MAISLGLFLAAAPAAVAAPSLALPIACTPGRDCFVQNYVDHDPGPGWKDYRCRSMSYDKHTGTDIRVPTLKAVQAGVPVRAALAGRVANLRDGVVDRPYVDGVDLHHQDCGNAVILDHPGGWTTIYCHMRQGSVRVKVGQAVAAGDTLGLVGESGAAAFPHLHFEIRHDRQLVDPFAFGADPSACAGGRMLWRPPVAQALAYRSPSVLNAGFAGGPVSMDQVEAGQTPPTSPATPLVAFVRAIGLEAGDQLSLTLAAPDGRKLAASAPLTLSGSRAQQLMFTGARRPAAGWARGSYRASFTVVRAGKPVISQSWSLGL